MIDWKRVIELRDEVGPAEFGPVLELFLDEVEGIVMRLSKEDRATLERDLHFLKGSAWNLGFADFGSLCHDCEGKACRGELQAISIADIVSSYAMTKQLFTRDLSRVVGGPGGNRAGAA